MGALATATRPPTGGDHQHASRREAPIVAAVDETAAGTAAAETAVRLARELEAKIVFVHVRSGPSSYLGEPAYQRRLTAKMAQGRRLLDNALAVAAAAGVDAEAELLEGSPRRRIGEFARDRRARLVVVGSRRHKVGRSVSCEVVRTAGRPVVVTHTKLPSPAMAGKVA